MSCSTRTIALTPALRPAAIRICMMACLSAVETPEVGSSRRMTCGLSAKAEATSRSFSGRHAHEEPTHIGTENAPKHDREGQRDHDEHDQRLRRKKRDPPILVIAEAHLIVSEELMVIERVPLVHGAQPLDVDRPVHEVS